MLPQTLTIFISPPPFSQHTEQRRPLGGLARAGGSPATVRSGTAGTWSGSYPFPLCFLSPFLSLSTMRQATASMAVGENCSAAADPLAGECLRPCARAPPSSGFAAVLELARAPRRPGDERGSCRCRQPSSGGADLSRTTAAAKAPRPGKSGGPFSLLGLGCVTFRSEIDSVPFFVFVSLIHERIHFPHLDLHARSRSGTNVRIFRTSRSRSNWRNSLLWVKPLFATIRGAAVEVDEVAPELENRSWTATSLCRGTGVVVQWWRQWSIPSLATLP